MAEKEMSPAERAARQMIEDKKAADATDKAYVRSLTSTEQNPVRKAKGGTVSASRRADGVAQRGKTRGKLV